MLAEPAILQELAGYTVLRGELLRTLVPLVAMCFLAATLALLSGAWLVRRRPRWIRTGRAQIGTAELEFALAFPVFLITVLITIQLSLMLNANLVVDYAAFCAARSATVWIPQDLPGEPSNRTRASSDSSSEKRERVENAAVLACVPISPRASSFTAGVGGNDSPVDEAELTHYLSGGLVPEMERHMNFSKLAADFADKWIYSSFYTEVSITNDMGVVTTDFSSDGRLTIVVTHKLEMAVPFAGATLGRILGARYVPMIGDYYVPITARYTMMNWGAHEAR